MRKLKIISMIFCSICIVFNFTACGEFQSEFSGSEISEIDETENTEYDVSGQTIYWLADYDLNPAENGERSTALALFEDVYGAKIEYIYTDANEKYDTLSSRLLSGEPVDMFPYEAMPDGVLTSQFQPLDDYFDVLEWNSDLWSDMHETADRISSDNKHYIIPYSISNPMLVTYSRTLMKSENLDDPYELYQNGEWNWNTFTDMMNTFVSKQIDGTKRYGFAGWYGESMFQSNGQNFISVDDTDPNVTKFIQDTADLYNDDWYFNFPSDKNTLFYLSSDWTLGSSNVSNPDDDIMVVPFPKSPYTEEYYLSCNLNARMLVKNSDKGEAVATYIKCERLVATSEIFQEAEKQDALTVKKNAKGNITGYITEEQYDAVQSYIDTDIITPMQQNLQSDAEILQNG